MSLQLSKLIPARTKTVKFLWCSLDFLEMSDIYNNIRKSFRNPMISCRWCGHKFKNGEMIALACPTVGSNMVLCQKCAAELLDSITDTDEGK